MSYFKKDTNEPGIIEQCKTKETTFVKKGWGNLFISGERTGEMFAWDKEQDGDFEVGTVKLLYIARNKKLSRHYHKNKSEFFIMVSGTCLIELWDETSEIKRYIVGTSQRIFVPPGLQHRMTGLDENNILLEVSTKDDPEDSYRVEKGD